MFFKLNGRLALTILIGGREFVLVGTADIGTSAEMTLEYHTDYAGALDFGTLAEALAALNGSIPGIKLDGLPLVAPAGSTNSPTPTWASPDVLAEKLKELPGFREMLTEVDSTSLRVTDLALRLQAPAADPPIGTSPELAGGLSVGFTIAFNSTPSHLIPGLNIEVSRITVFLSFDLGTT